MTLEQLLSDKPGASTWRAREAGRPCVLRLADSARVHALEAALFARLEHPALVAPLRTGRAPGGGSFLLRPWVAGDTLDVALAAATPAQAVEWTATLLDLLGLLHAAGLVHRDVKASNVVVGPDGLRLVDLDLLERLGSGPQAAGSAFHIAPETLRGAAPTPSADLFSVGALLALAYCGAPTPGFHERFPAQPFWTAAGLDAGRLPGELSALVAALVRRHPSERPVSAAAALQLLPGERAPRRPEPRLAFVQGREATVGEIAELAAVPGDVVLVVVEDDEELAPLSDAIELELAVAGRPAVRAAGELDGPDEEAPRAGRAERVLVCCCASADAGAIAGRVMAALDPELCEAAVFVMPRAVEAELAERLAARAVDQARRPPRRVVWPRPSRAALEEHLLQLTGAANPALVRELAASLHARSAGRRRDVNALLAVALEDGVLRASGAQLEVLRTDWPAHRGGSPAEAASLDRWPPAARAALAALAALGGSGEAELVGELAGLDAEELGAALAAMHAHGALDGDRAGPELHVADPRWCAAALAALPPVELRDVRRRALAALERRSAPRERRAALMVELARTAKELAEVLQIAEELRVSGRPARARELAERAARAAPRRADALRRRAAALLARLDIGLGDAAHARQQLRARLGPELADADAPLLRVAAEAAQLCGRSEEARGLYRRALALRPTAGEELLARVGLGYAEVLDGHPELALEQIADRPRARDPHAAAAAALNLRGGALAQLGRLDEARKALRRARGRASASGDPTHLGRSLLNLAFVDRRQGRPAAALEGLGAAMEAFTEAGHVPLRALAANNLGTLQRDLGDLRAARRSLERAYALRRRAGDGHGAGSSLGSLALVSVEAGALAEGLRRAAAARELLASGGHRAELDLLELHVALALALSGEVRTARERLGAPELDAARRAHPVLAGRIGALIALVEGREDDARAALEDLECDVGSTAAERFRVAALRLVLDARDADARERLRAAAAALGGTVRRAEAEWRARELDAAVARRDLERWIETFDAAGRTDLVRAAALELSALHDRAGRARERRAARERAQEAADALGEGLTGGARAAAIERLDRLAGGRPAPAVDARPGVEWLTECTRRLAREEDLDGLLLAIVDMALEVTGGRRGWIVLLDGTRFEVQAARNMDRAGLRAEEAGFSRSVVLEASRSGVAVLTTDASTDARFASMESVSSLRLHSVLCVPFRSPSDDVAGALYLDHAELRAAFDETDIERVGVLADQAAIAITHLRRRARILALNERLREQVEYQRDQLVRTRKLLRRGGSQAPIGDLVGGSAAMQRVYGLIERLAPTDLTVLVTGPSGAGKDLVAHALHAHSKRAEGPLVIENVAALPAELVESELFGHVRGAFTGATAERKGLFEEADGGTFFLDEVGEMPLELQAKLLRLLETGEFRPVGSATTLRKDVRLIAATHRDLPTLVREGRFREDLFYRLDAAEIRVPSLAERTEDVPELVEHFLERLAARHGKRKPMADAVLAELVRRTWPGEVRELSNEVARLYFLSGERIEDPAAVRSPRAIGGEQPEVPASLTLESAERAAIERALHAAGHRKDRAAKLLGISRAGLYTKLARLGMRGARPEA